jgi:hypothetical protein
MKRAARGPQLKMVKLQWKPGKPFVRRGFGLNLVPQKAFQSFRRPFNRGAVFR